MISIVEQICGICGKEIQVVKAEYNRRRRLGQQYFFCGHSCAGKYRNSKRPNRRRPVTKTCPHCGKNFDSDTGKRAATFCSRSCASSGSVTEYRKIKSRESGLRNLSSLSLETTAKGLRKRERAKYVQVAEYLDKNNLKHQFEYVLEDIGIFDLALLDANVLIEFDGKYHRGKEQQCSDRRKTCRAEALGWIVVRVDTGTDTVMPVGPVSDILDLTGTWTDSSVGRASR